MRGCCTFFCCTGLKSLPDRIMLLLLSGCKSSPPAPLCLLSLQNLEGSQVQIEAGSISNPQTRMGITSRTHVYPPLDLTLNHFGTFASEHIFKEITMKMVGILPLTPSSVEVNMISKLVITLYIHDFLFSPYICPQTIQNVSFF